MAQFQWNYLYPSGDLKAAYENYLQNSSYVNDITKILNGNKSDLEKFQRTDLKYSDRISKGIELVCGTIDHGFSELTEKLGDVNYSIQDLTSEVSDMASMLDWNLSSLIEGQKITNEYLGKITELLKIPDIQKERVYYIEEGLKYLKNALLDKYNSDFYEDAHIAFSKALEREINDFFSLNKLGFIYLNSKKYLNFEIAESYFKKSIKYALAEANVNGTTTTNNIVDFYKEKRFGNLPLKTASESILYCARALALQKKYSEAVDICKMAIELIPNFDNATYDTAKYLCLDNRVNEALPYIELLISNDKFQCLKILADSDLICHQQIINKLEEIKENNKLKVEIELNNLNGKITQNSIFHEKHLEAVKYYKENSLFSILNSLEILTSEYSWVYPIYLTGDSNSISMNKRSIGYNNTFNYKDIGVYSTTTNLKSKSKIVVPDKSNEIKPIQFLKIENESEHKLNSLKLEILENRTQNALTEKRNKFAGLFRIFFPVIPAYIFLSSHNFFKDNWTPIFDATIWFLVAYGCGYVISYFLGRFLSMLITAESISVDEEIKIYNPSN